MFLADELGAGLITLIVFLSIIITVPTGSAAPYTLSSDAQ